MLESLTDILQNYGARKIAQFTGAGVVRTREHSGITTGTEHTRLTFYSVRAKLLIYCEYVDGAGWDVFVPIHEGNAVAPTLDAVRTYLRTPYNEREHSKRETDGDSWHREALQQGDE